MKSADLLLKSMSTAADCSGSADRTDSSWTQDDEIWTMLAQSTTNWNQLRTDGYQTWRETWSHCKCTSSISQGLFKEMKRNTDNIQRPTNKKLLSSAKNIISLIFWFTFYLFLSQYNFSVTFNFIFLNFIHNFFLKCHRVNSDGPSLVKQTQNGLLADGEWTSDTHYNRSAIWVVFWPNGPHTASQLSNRYLPLLEDQVCEVGANLKKHTHTHTRLLL